jgi:hypothetical protein
MPQAQKDLNVYSGKLLARFEKIILKLYSEPTPTQSQEAQWWYFKMAH